jgi:hypothetical protein
VANSTKKMETITGSVMTVGEFAEPQREFLELPRTNVFLKREVNAGTKSASGRGLFMR